MSDFIYNDFSGTTNQHSAPHLLQNNQAEYDINIVRDVDGAIAHRLGSRILAGVGGGVTGEIQGAGIYTNSSGVQTLCIVAGGNFYKFNTTTNAFDLVSSSVVSTSSTVEFKPYIGKLYFIGSGGTEYLKSYNGSSISTVSGNIVGTFLEVSNSRLYVGGGINAANPRRIFFSNVGNDTFTTASDYVDLDATVTGLKSLGESNPLLGFDTETITVMDPAQSYSRKIEGNFACLSHRSIQNLQGHAIFLARDGFYRMSSVEAYPIKISTPVENQVTYDAFFNRISQNGFKTAAAFVRGNKYYCCVGDLTSDVKGESHEDFWFVMDLKQVTWQHRTYSANGLGAVFIDYVNDSSDTRLALAGSKDAPIMYEFEVENLYTDEDTNGDEQSVTAKYRTKYFEIPIGSQGSAGVETQKTLTKGFVKFKADSALTMKYSKDASGIYSSWTTTTVTNNSVGYEWNALSPFRDPSFKSLSVGVEGTGNWILYSLGFNISPNRNDQLTTR